MKNILRFSSTVLAGIALTGTLFFALSFNARMALDQAAYSIIHQSFPSSSLELVVEISTLILTAVWMYSERQTYRRFYTLLGSVIFFTISLVIYFVYVASVNKQTHNWTEFSDSWTSLRSKWEYAQLARGICSLAGFSLIVVHLLVRKTKSSRTKYPGKSY